MNWKLHVARLANLGRIPFGTALRRWKRRTVGYRPDPGNIRGTLLNFEEMDAAVTSLGRGFSGATVLEIGTGWFPSIPILLSLRGVRRVVLTDLNPHLDDVTFAATLDALKPQLGSFPNASGKSTLHDFNLEYLAPFRPEQVPDGSIDFVISRTVLEHIPPADITLLLQQLRPKLTANGLMVHCIDHSDHLEHRDKTLSKINFLTWSPRLHQAVNWLTKEGENRLRHHEYRELFQQAGYDIVSESGHVHAETCERARTLSLQGRFASMTPEQVSVLASVYVLAPKAGAL